MSTDNFWNPQTVNYVLLIIISGVIGGFITYVLKFLFETHLPAWKLRKARQVSIQKYQLPLLLYGYAAKNSILTILKNSETKCNADLRLRTLYYICAFLGWCQVLSRKSLIEFVERGLMSSTAIETFGTHYNNIVRGISSVDYFFGLEDTFDDSLDAARVPALAVTAIGDSMVRGDEKVNGIYPEVIGFKEFMNYYKNDLESKEWFACIENVLDYKTRSGSDLRWNRLVIFYTHIEVFTYYLETRNKNSILKKIRFINKIRRTSRKKPYVVIDKICKEIHPTVKKRLQNEMSALGIPFTYGKIKSSFLDSKI